MAEINMSMNQPYLTPSPGDVAHSKMRASMVQNPGPFPSGWTSYSSEPATDLALMGRVSAHSNSPPSLNSWPYGHQYSEHIPYPHSTPPESYPSHPSMLQSPFQYNQATHGMGTPSTTGSVSGPRIVSPPMVGLHTPEETSENNPYAVLRDTIYLPRVSERLNISHEEAMLREQKIYEILSAKKSDPTDDEDSYCSTVTTGQKRKREGMSASRKRAKQTSHTAFLPPLPAWHEITNDMSEEERQRRIALNLKVAEERKARAREQNRLAAQKVRDRKLEHVRSLESRIRMLEVAVSFWRARIVSLGGSEEEWDVIPEELRKKMMEEKDVKKEN